MQRWTPQHAKFVGRVIFANFLNFPLENYRSIIEEAERLSIFKRLSGDSWDQKRNSPAIRTRRLSRANTLNDEDENRSSTVVAKIENRLRRPSFAEARGYGVTSGQGTGRGNRFTIRYACEGFNRMYVIDNAVRDELCADKNIRSMIFRLRRISSRNALTHAIIKGVIEHQGGFLSTGDPIDLVPLSQVQLTKKLPILDPPSPRLRRTSCRLPIAGNEKSQIENQKSKICNSWVSRLVNGISVIIPSGEEKPLKSFFQTQKDVNKRLIKQLLDKENEDIESESQNPVRNTNFPDSGSKIFKAAFARNPKGRAKPPAEPRNDERLTEDGSPYPKHTRKNVYNFWEGFKGVKKPLTDNQIKTELESKYGVKISRHSIGQCRKVMGIPPAGRRLSGYKYPPLSANFSMLYPLVLEEVLRNAPSSSGIYEFRLKGKEIEYSNGKTQVIYIGSTRNIKKRLREHLGKSSKNGHIRDFLKNHDCSFRYIQFSKNWQQEERRLYSLFVTTYGAPPKCNRVKPGGGK